jgi:hypothetical protein
MDYEIDRSAKSCAATGREFAPGEEFYSVLMAEGTEWKRCDYAAEAWQGPPAGAIGWWKSQMPDQHARRAHWAPNDLLLNFFDELAEQPDKQDMRYVLALLLVRRRVMRLEEEQRDEAGHERLTLYCPRRDAQYEVAATAVDRQRIDEIQQVLAKLLER